MKKYKNIHNIDTLDKEIYSLQLEARNMEGKLNRNLDHLHDNYLSMAVNSFSCKKENTQKDKEHGFWEHFFTHTGFKTLMKNVANEMAAKAGENLQEVLKTFFAKKTH